MSFTETEEQPIEDSTQGFIWCHGCGFSSDIFINVAIAKQFWNRRTNPANEPLTCEGCESHDLDAECPERCLECSRMSRRDLYRRKSAQECQ